MWKRIVEQCRFMLASFFFFKVYYFLAVLGLRCCTQAFSSRSDRGLLSGRGAWTPRCGGFSCCGAQALGAQASVLVAHRLSCSEAHGIFLDHGSTSVPCLARRILNLWATGKAQCLWFRTPGVRRHCGLEPEQCFPNSVSVEGLGSCSGGTG